MVKIYYEGDEFAIETTEKDEGSFLEAIGNLLSEMIDKEVFSSKPEEHKHETLTYYSLSGFLPLIVEICCKMRGYKSSVQEKRLLTAGEFSPSFNPSVAIIKDSGDVDLVYEEGEPRRLRSLINNSSAIRFGIDHKENCPRKEEGLEAVSESGECPACHAGVWALTKEMEEGS